MMSPRCCQENCGPYLHFVFSWQRLLKSFPKASDKDLSCFFCFFYSLPLLSLPFLLSQLLLTLICTCYPTAQTLSHAHTVHSFRDRGLCVLETKAPLSPEWELSFRLKLTVSEGRGRADDGPRIRYVVKCVCVCVRKFTSLHLSVFWFRVLWMWAWISVL